MLTPDNWERTSGGYDVKSFKMMTFTLGLLDMDSGSALLVIQMIEVMNDRSIA